MLTSSCHFNSIFLIDLLFNRPSTGRTATSNMSGPPGSSHTSGDFLVILADKELLRLPLEAIPFFRSANVSSISRDFSLQILRHRLIDGNHNH